MKLLALCGIAHVLLFAGLVGCTVRFTPDWRMLSAYVALATFVNMFALSDRRRARMLLHMLENAERRLSRFLRLPR